MSDREAFERVMELMGMEAEEEIIVGGKLLLVEYRDKLPSTEQFSKMGYDEFYAGALYDGEGNIMKGYMDSHVAFSSENCKKFQELKGRITQETR